jgi:predicted RNA-binding Zn ribbon-like protein
VPDRFARVVAFANTHSYLGHDDDLDELRTAKRAMRAIGLVAPRGDGELDALRTVRDALRDLISQPLGQATEILASLLTRHPVTVTLHSGPVIGIPSTRDPVAAALGEVVTAVLHTDWHRLHTCANADECAVVFYDSSRGRQGRWCSAELCGNRVNSRLHRSRMRGA